MRINKFVAVASGISRRNADRAIQQSRVQVNGIKATIGQDVSRNDIVSLDNKVLLQPTASLTIALNKPLGFVCSRNGQGSPTIYDLLPENLQALKSIGRLDKNSSGLLLLTNDGQLANRLTHPSFLKKKVYKVLLNKPLSAEDIAKINRGIKVENYTSRLRFSNQSTPDTLKGREFVVSLTQGKNRQVRKTFATLGYVVKSLHRIQFAEYSIDGLESGKFKFV